MLDIGEYFSCQLISGQNTSNPMFMYFVTVHPQSLCVWCNICIGLTDHCTEKWCHILSEQLAPGIKVLGWQFTVGESVSQWETLFKVLCTHMTMDIMVLKHCTAVGGGRGSRQGVYKKLCYEAYLQVNGESFWLSMDLTYGCIEELSLSSTWSSFIMPTSRFELCCRILSGRPSAQYPGATVDMLVCGIEQSSNFHGQIGNRSQQSEFNHIDNRTRGQGRRQKRRVCMQKEPRDH